MDNLIVLNLVDQNRILLTHTSKLKEKADIVFKSCTLLSYSLSRKKKQIVSSVGS